MNFFEQLFGTSSEHGPQPDLACGRYSDSYKTNEQYDSWDKSLELFEEEKYLESYREFFFYLRDEYEDNVTWKEENGTIHFEVLQGSKKAVGKANVEKVTIEAKIAKTETLNIAFMRRLLERNFQLRYSRFALDDEDNITIRFDTYILDGSPYKLYYALKELTTNADKLDDLLIDEFGMLSPVDTSHLRELSLEEKEVKYNFLSKEINAAIKAMDSGDLNPDQYPGGIAYILLNLTYKLDYLLKPEGFMMETLERIHRKYFATDGKNTAQKNVSIRKELKKILERPKEELFKEMYLTKATFGITTPVNHDKVVGFIDGEIENMDWYNQHGFETIAISVPGYIVGYCMFSYAVPFPTRELFHLYYQIVEADYFKALGFTLDYYDSEKKTFDKKAIKRAIKKIESNNKNSYPDFHPDTSTLDFSTLANFANSFLKMVKVLDLTKQ